MEASAYLHETPPQLALSVAIRACQSDEFSARHAAPFTPNRSLLPTSNGAFLLK